jgi:hypothetical protein
MSRRGGPDRGAGRPPAVLDADLLLPCPPGPKPEPSWPHRSGAPTWQRFRCNGGNRSKGYGAGATPSGPSRDLGKFQKNIEFGKKATSSGTPSVTTKGAKTAEISGTCVDVFTHHTTPGNLGGVGRRTRFFAFPGFSEIIPGASALLTSPGNLLARTGNRGIAVEAILSVFSFLSSLTRQSP